MKKKAAKKKVIKQRVPEPLALGAAMERYNEYLDSVYKERQDSND